MERKNQNTKIKEKGEAGVIAILAMAMILGMTTGPWKEDPEIHHYSLCKKPNLVVSLDDLDKALRVAKPGMIIEIEGRIDQRLQERKRALSKLRPKGGGSAKKPSKSRDQLLMEQISQGIERAKKLLQKREENLRTSGPEERKRR